MARHIRTGAGTDQRGVRHLVGYHPDWLRKIKIARRVASGRRSLRTLLVNRESPKTPPPERVRTLIQAGDAPPIELWLKDPATTVRSIRLTCRLPDGDEEVEYVVECAGGGAKGR